MFNERVGLSMTKNWSRATGPNDVADEILSLGGETVFLRMLFDASNARDCACSASDIENRRWRSLPPFRTTHRNRSIPTMFHEHVVAVRRRPWSRATARAKGGGGVLTKRHRCAGRFPFCGCCSTHRIRASARVLQLRCCPPLTAIDDIEYARVRVFCMQHGKSTMAILTPISDDTPELNYSDDAQ